MRAAIKKIWNYRKNKKQDRSFDEINIILERAWLKKKRGQFTLEKEMRVFMRRFLKVGANSKFIPIDKKSDTVIKEIVEKKFGSRMAKLDISLNDKLEIVIR